MSRSVRLAIGSALTATACLAYACSATENVQTQPDASDPDTGSAVEAGGDPAPRDAGVDAAPTDAGQTVPEGACGVEPMESTYVNPYNIGWADRGPCDQGVCQVESHVYEVFVPGDRPVRPLRVNGCKLLSFTPGKTARWCCPLGCIKAGGAICNDSTGTSDKSTAYQCPAYPDGGGLKVPTPGPGCRAATTAIDESYPFQDFCCPDPVTP